MVESIALRWGDIDFDTEALHVYSSDSLGTLTAPKSGLTRMVPMAEQVRDLPKAYKKTVPHGRGDVVSQTSPASTSTAPPCGAAT